MTRCEFLKTVSVFHGLDDAEIRKIDAIALEMVLKKGDELFSEGSKGEDFSIIWNGVIAIYKKVAGGRKRILVNLEPGKVFGELALFDNQPRSAQAESSEETRLINLNIVKFQALLDSEPVLASKFQRNIILMLCTRLREANEKLNQGVIWGFKTQG